MTRPDIFNWQLTLCCTKQWQRQCLQWTLYSIFHLYKYLFHANTWQSYDMMCSPSIQDKVKRHFGRHIFFSFFQKYFLLFIFPMQENGLMPETCRPPHSISHATTLGAGIMYPIRTLLSIPRSTLATHMWTYKRKNLTTLLAESNRKYLSCWKQYKIFVTLCTT